MMMIIIKNKQINKQIKNNSNQGAVRGCFFFKRSPHCAANRLPHARTSSQDVMACKPRATHIGRLSPATRRVPHGVEGSSAIKFVKVQILALFHWMRPSSDQGTTSYVMQELGTTSPSFFLCVPQLYLWGSPFLVGVLRM